MARKLLYTLCLFIISGAAAYSQILSISPADTVYIDTAVSSGQGTVSLNISALNNTANDTLQMKWKVLTNTMPHPWTISFCDPANCYTSSIFTTGASYTLYPGETGLFKLDATPDCLADTSTFSIHTWAPSDSAATSAILTWELSVGTPNCIPAGIATIETAQVSIYPNPVISALSVNIAQNPDNARIDIFNLLGSKVYSQAISTRESDFDLSTLESGIYIARISNAGQIVTTKKFTKE